MLEDEFKVMDWRQAERLGLKPDDPDLAAKVVTAHDTLVGLREARETSDIEIANCTNGMEVIKATPNSAGAIAAADKKKRGKQMLPLEAEYRDLSLRLKVANAKVKSMDAAIKKAEKAMVDLWYVDRGSFTTAMDNLMTSLKLHRCAWFSGTMNGNDVHDVFKPLNAPKFAELMRAKLACTTQILTVEGKVMVKLDLGFEGSDDRAAQYAAIMEVFGKCSSLLTRVEALCEHEIAEYRESYNQYAVLYAEMFPDSEMHPKGHGMGYHVGDQMDETGTSGQSVWRGADRVVARARQRVGPPQPQYPRERGERARARAKAHLAMTCPGIKNIRTSSHSRDYALRQRVKEMSRISRFSTYRPSGSFMRGRTE